MSENAFRAKDLGLRAQKKIFSRMASKSVAKVFIDDTTASLLDNVYRLIKQHTGNKKDAERIVKNIIKIVIKIAVLNKNDQFDAEEVKLANKFQCKFHNLQMTIISFHEVDFSFDLKYLQNILVDLRQMLQSLVKRHLTDKSHNRIDEVFDFFNDAVFLETTFKQNSPYRDLMDKIVTDIHTAMEAGSI